MTDEVLIRVIIKYCVFPSLATWPAVPRGCFFFSFSERSATHLSCCSVSAGEGEQICCFIVDLFNMQSFHVDSFFLLLLVFDRVQVSVGPAWCCGRADS